MQLLVTSPPGGCLSGPYFLLFVRRRASSPCSLWHSVFQPLSVTGGFALLVALRPNFFHCNFIKKLCERSGLWARKKGKDFFPTWASCQLQRTCSSFVVRRSSYLQRMPVPWQTINKLTILDKRSIRADCWILKLFYPTDPWNTDKLTHESLRKSCLIFGKLTCSKQSCSSVGFLTAILAFGFEGHFHSPSLSGPV